MGTWGIDRKLRNRRRNTAGGFINSFFGLPETGYRHECKKSFVLKTGMLYYLCKQLGAAFGCNGLKKKGILTGKEVEKKIKQVISEYQDLFDTIILFGSFAREEQTKDSDIDLFILSDISTNKLLTSEAYNDFHDRLYELFDNRVPFDLLVFGGKRDVKEVMNSSFYFNVKNDGVVLYDKRAKAV